MERAMTEQARGFERMMQARVRAADAYVQGDGEPVSAMSTEHGPATFFGPRGAFEKDAGTIRERYVRDAKVFGPGGTNRIEILHSAVSGDLGYWVGFQHASAPLAGQSEPVTMTLRVTELFRCEGGEWKLMHRHAEMIDTPHE
jgi:ketosteroid isomerase-like protein